MANPFTRLQRYFRIVVKSDKSSVSNKELLPGERVSAGDGTKPADFPPLIQRIWDFWKTETQDNTNTLKDRIGRYKDLNFMVKNDNVISMAMDLYADEATQADSQDRIISVEARDKKVRGAIQDILDHWGFANQSMVRSKAYDLAEYGDSFNVHSIQAGKGITSTTPVSPFAIADRIEFNALNAKKELEKSGFLSTLASRDTRIKVLADMIDKPDDYGMFFRSYLFGFQIDEDLYIPPWNMAHFRLFTTESEFYPFGKPLMINSISTFRQLKTSLNLQAIARAAKFPIEKYEVTVDESMTEVEKWDAVNQARQEYANMGITTQYKDEMGIGSKIFLPQGLMDMTLIENNMDLGDIGDIELLRDNMIMGTRVPKGYLVVDRSSFGTSGQSLLQQFKPFGRAVYYIQSAILKEISQMLRIHFLLTEEFDKEFTEFDLKMNFPVIEESRDRLSMKSDTMRLASDILTNLGQAIGLDRDESLPPDIVKQVYSKYTFIEPKDLDRWIDDIVKVKQQAKPDDQGGNSFYSQDEDDGPKHFKEKRSLSEKINRLYEDGVLSENLLMNAYFDAKKSLGIREGVFAQKHLYSSENIDQDQEILLSSLRRSGSFHNGKLTEFLESKYAKMDLKDIEEKHRRRKE